jgi:hypothetical protein
MDRRRFLQSVGALLAVPHAAAALHKLPDPPPLDLDGIEPIYETLSPRPVWPVFRPLSKRALKRGLKELDATIVEGCFEREFNTNAVYAVGQLAPSLYRRGHDGFAVSLTLLPHNETMARLGGWTELYLEGGEGLVAFIPSLWRADPGSLPLTILVEGDLVYAEGLQVDREVDLILDHCGLKLGSPNLRILVK